MSKEYFELILGSNWKIDEFWVLGHKCEDTCVSGGIAEPT